MIENFFVGVINLCKNLVEERGVQICQRIAFLGIDNAKTVAVFVNKFNCYGITVCINRYIMVGHNRNFIAVRIGPRHKIITGNIGRIAEYVEVCANRQVRLKELGTRTLAVHINDFVKILETNGCIEVYGNRTDTNASKQSRSRIGRKSELGNNFVYNLFHNCFCVNGNAAASAKHTVFTVEVGKAGICRFFGKQIDNCKQVILYLIISVFFGRNFINGKFFELGYGIRIQNRFDIHTDLCLDYIGNRLRNGCTLCAVHNVRRGNCRYINVELRFYAVQNSLYCRNLLGAVCNCICLDCQGLDISHYIFARLVSNDFANALHAGHIRRNVNQVVKCNVGKLITGLFAYLFQCRLYIGNVGQYGKEFIGIHCVQNFHNIRKRKRIGKCRGVVAVCGCNGKQFYF